MQLQTGMIVRAIAGKEQDGFYLVIRQDQDFVYLADGKHRKLSQPKRKNPRHVRATSTILDRDCLSDLTDLKLHRMLREYQKKQVLQGGE